MHDAAHHARSEAEAIRTARLVAQVGGRDAVIVLGNAPYTDPVRTLNAGRISAEHEMSDAQWEVFAEGANRIAHAVKRETGLRTVFHHHIGTWVETPAETARFLRLTDPAIVGLCFDTGHYRFGGGDPLEGVQRHADRIWHVHFKDYEPNVGARSRQEGWDAIQSVAHGVFCELGLGEINFPALLAELHRLNYQGWVVVEQDVVPGMGNPRESARRNRAYLTQLGV